MTNKRKLRYMLRVQHLQTGDLTPCPNTSFMDGGSAFLLLDYYETMEAAQLAVEKIDNQGGSTLPYVIVVLPVLVPDFVPDEA